MRTIRFPMSREDARSLRNIGIGDIRHGNPNRLTFEHGADFQNLFGLLRAALRDGESAIGLRSDQPLGDQLQQRFADRDFADTVARGDLVLIHAAFAGHLYRQDQFNDKL